MNGRQPVEQRSLDLPGKTRCGYCNTELEPHGSLDGQTIYQCPAFPDCARPLVEIWKELYGD